MTKKKPSETAAETVSIPYLKIVLCLFLICTVCAGLLGATYLVTAEPIRLQEETAIRETLASLFGEDAVCEECTVPEGQDVLGVYLARDPDGTARGYAIRLLTPGFSDDIDLIVGYTTAGEILKIEILSLSETAGLGSRIAEDEHLGQYNGKSGELALKKDIDAVSGATKSSRALLNGVNRATECFRALGA